MQPKLTNKTVALQVNGSRYTLDVGVHQTLLEVLRERLDLTGAKAGCNQGECGACTVLGVVRAAAALDLDNDADLDLYVVNGWVSGSPDPKDNYVLDIFQIIVDPEIDLADARNWPPMGTKTLSGFQRNRLFHNQGGVYKDEGRRHGLDTLEDLRIGHGK